MVLFAAIRPHRERAAAGDADARIHVRPLAWDTNFFGARMGALAPGRHSGGENLVSRADLLADELRKALREAELDGYQHLAYRVGAEDLPAIWAAERAGLRLMDVAVDLTFALGTTPLPKPPSRAVRNAGSADVPAVRAMTVGAFGLTRFAVDPFFTHQQVDNFYETWATNLFSDLADVVLVTDIDGRPAGFVSCKVHHLDGKREGRIPLVATAGAYQRRGVARDLLSAALSWFAEAACEVAHVKTQAANYSALALYERAGFTVTQTELTFTTTLN
jgi:ribosomal protein S18 acetylase RimI-like enzyme